ncbi:MAG: CPBP family intramembrane glutamic endopeptidase [Candidatus Limnocylindrales bacterium]
MIPSDPGSPVERDRPPPPPVEPPRLGAGTFTIEGRSAPGLFVVGWLASIVGLVAVVVALLAGQTLAATVLLVIGMLSLAIGLVAGAGSQGIERRARAGAGTDGRYTGPSPFLVFAASIPVTGLIVIGAGVLFDLVGVSVDGPLARLASVSISAGVYIALIRLLVVDAGALSWSGMGVHRPAGRAIAELATGALWAAPVIVATLPVAWLVTQLVPVTPTSPLPPTGETVGLAINLLAGAIVAPIGEELLFRGLATTAWARDIGERRGLIRGALFFAAVHVLTISGDSAGSAMGLALVAFATRIPVALALGWLFVRRRTIWAPVGLHAAFNAVLLIIAESALQSPVPTG